MTDPVLVMKFGGTNVGSPEAIRRAARLVTEHASERNVAVVVSAMSQVTNQLLATLDAAAQGKSAAVLENIKQVREKHFKACADLLPDSAQASVRENIGAVLGDFERIAKGMLFLRERPQRSVDEAVPAGERLSALLLSEVLSASGTPACVISGADVIVTDAAFGAASPKLPATRDMAEAQLRPLLDEGIVPVITGFNGATQGGIPTTLGRGGSDFSASIVAAALQADELCIWTDVDGILSCDPSVAQDARLLAEVTYNEAAELAYNGAKVLHSRTLAPLVDLGIPVRIRNSFKPERTGTRISSRKSKRAGVHAVTSLSDVVLISIESADASLSGAQLMARALAAAARAKVEVLLLTRSSFRQNFCMLVHLNDVDPVLQHLREELSLELAHGYLRPIDVDPSVGLLAAVGEGMRGTPGLAGRLFTSISRENVNIIAIAQGSSELTIAIVVNKKDLATAVAAIHREFRLGVRIEEPKA